MKTDQMMILTMLNNDRLTAEEAHALLQLIPADGRDQTATAVPALSATVVGDPNSLMETWQQLAHAQALLNDAQATLATSVTILNPIIESLGSTVGAPTRSMTITRSGTLHFAVKATPPVEKPVATNEQASRRSRRNRLWQGIRGIVEPGKGHFRI